MGIVAIDALRRSRPGSRTDARDRSIAAPGPRTTSARRSSTRPRTQSARSNHSSPTSPRNAPSPSFERLCHYIHDTYPGVLLILDAKRGDIGPTAQQYAREAFERYGADVVTVNPYLGTDSHRAVLDATRSMGSSSCAEPRTRAAAISSRSMSTVNRCTPTSPGAASRNGARSVNAVSWSGPRIPTSCVAVRAIVGDMPLLVPGVGAQGADIEATVAAGRPPMASEWSSTRRGQSSTPRAEPDFAEAATHAAVATRDEIREYAQR